MGFNLADLGHPIRLLEDVPGVPFLEHLAGKTASDLFGAAEAAPGGIITLGKTAFTDPGKLPGIFEQIGKQTLTDIEHPLRHPGFTALDLLGLVAIPGAIAGRGLAAASVASRTAEIARTGELPAELATREAAQAAGKLSERGRLVDPIKEKAGVPITEALRSHESQMAKALLFGPAKEARMISVPMTAAHKALETPGSEILDSPAAIVRQSGWMYSKDPFIKAAQKQIDKLYATHPDALDHTLSPWRLVPGFQRTTHGRLSSAIKADQLALKKEAAGKGAAFLREFKDMTEKDWLTLRIVGEATTPQDLLQMHTDQLAQGKLNPKQLAETNRRMDLIPQVMDRIEYKTHIDSETGVERSVPVLKQDFAEANPRVVKFIDDAREISKDREWASEMSGILNHEGKYRRLTAPFEFAKTGKLPINMEHLNRSIGQHRRLGNKKMVQQLEALKAEVDGQLSLYVPDEHHKGVFLDDAERQRFADSADLFRVPYAFQKENPFLKVGLGTRRAFKGNKPKVPGTYTHPFTASIMKTGGGEANVARLLAESYTEAQRFLGLRAIRNRLLQSAVYDPSKIPEHERALIKTDENVSYQMPQKRAEQYTRENVIEPTQTPEKIAGMEEAGTESLMDKPGRLSPLEAIAGGRLYEGIRQRLFPDMEGRKTAGAPPPGYLWIDKRLLGGLNKPNPLIGLYEYNIANRIIRGVDTANSALKSTMLFLRPAYLLPNMLGNVALNLVQQGAFAPYHIYRSYKIHKGLSPRDRVLARAQMGEGVESIAFEKGNLAETFAHKASQVYGKVMDTPFRLNAFYHEAAQMGFDTSERVHELLTDAKFREELKQVTNNANDEIINYERMSPSEEALLRRLVLFYPFTKGASRYAINFPKTHPLASGISSTTGQYGEERTAEIMGMLPPYLAGAFPSNESGTKIMNPASFSILGEPATLGRQILNVLSGSPTSHMELTQNLAPIDQALLDILSGGKTSTLGHTAGTPNLNIASGEATGSIPFVSLYNQLRGRASGGGPLESSIYPTASYKDALIRYFGFGGLWPRTVNPDLLNYKGYQASIGR